MFCWHKWGMWSAPQQGTYTDGKVVLVQVRECPKCGKMQVKPIERK